MEVGKNVLWPSRQASWMAYFALYSSSAATDMVGCVVLMWSLTTLYDELKLGSDFRHALA